MKQIIITTFILFGYSAGAQNTVLEADEFSKKLGQPNTIILDVRTPDEYNTGHIENAREIDYRNPDFKSQISKLDPSQTYLVYCRSGKRSASAIDSLQSIGIKNVYDLKGGIIEWNKKELPLVGGASDKISQKEYNKILSSDAVVLIDFYAPWCGPCLKMEPMFNRLAEQYKDQIKLVRINADENKVLAKSFTQKGFPVLIGYKNGTIIWDRVGLLEEKEVVSLIEELIH